MQVYNGKLDPLCGIEIDEKYLKNCYCLTIASPKKKDYEEIDRFSPRMLTIGEMFSELFSNVGGYVRFRNKDYRHPHAVPVQAARDGWLEKQFVNNPEFTDGKVNKKISLCTYQDGKKGTQKNIQAVCAVAVKFDAKYDYENQREMSAWETYFYFLDLLEKESKKEGDGIHYPIPMPAYSSCAHGVTLIWTLEEPFILCGKNRIGSIEYIKAVVGNYAGYINELDKTLHAKPLRLTEMVNIPGFSEAEYTPYVTFKTDWDHELAEPWTLVENMNGAIVGKTPRKGVTKEEIHYTADIKYTEYFRTSDVSYTLQELEDRILRFTRAEHKRYLIEKKKREPKISCKGEVGAQFKSFKFLDKRQNLLEKYQKAADECMEHREACCFLYYNNLLNMGVPVNEAREKVLEYNERFSVPLPSIQVLNRIQDHLVFYPFRNETFFAFMGITKECAAELGYTSYLSYAENAAYLREYQRLYRVKMREKNFKETYAYKKEKMEEKALNLREAGKKLEEIAATIGKSLSTIKRYIKAAVKRKEEEMIRFLEEAAKKAEKEMKNKKKKNKKKKKKTRKETVVTTIAAPI